MSTHLQTTPWRAVKARRYLQDQPPASPRAGLRVRLTERDLELLRFVAAHRFVQAEHLHHLIAADRSVTYRLLSRLTNSGLLRYERVFHAQAGVFMITNGGLAVIDSPLPRPQIDLRLYRHEQHVPALWLAATDGLLGPVARVRTERELRHYDRLPDTGEVVGVRLGGFHRGGRPRVHHPDLAIAHPDGTLTAVELELSLKANRRLEEILLGYVLDQRLRVALYLTDQDQVGRGLQRIAGQYGAPGKVIVKRVRELSTEGILNRLNGSVV